MGSYAYEDFRLTFDRRPGSDSVYTVHAVSHNNVRSGEFTLPMPVDDLERAVLDAASALSVRARRSTGTVRDVGRPEALHSNAKQLGSALAGALFAGEIGDEYESAWDEIEGAPDRGLRLTLSLGRTPELLSLPWEFLFRRPTFLAVQPHLPLVRHLDVGGHAKTPRPIDKAVRILGVISNPVDLPPLDVESERLRMNTAVDEMAKRGRVELDWLPDATPEALFEALRDRQYHVLHYVGHSNFVVDDDGTGEGVLFLEHADDRHAVPVDSVMLANLLGNQSQLQLVVLNSCEGARTALTDPFAGVATTLIQLGVPAVIAMQFEISDEAAIVFAEELYRNLIGRQVPIDTAVADARRAVYVRGNQVEWATPVLFLRDPETELFTFALAPVPLVVPWWRRSLDRLKDGRVRLVGLVVLVVVALAAGAALLWPDGSSPTPSTSPSPTQSPTPSSASAPTTTASPGTNPPAPPLARLGEGTYAVAIADGAGSTHLFEVEASSGEPQDIAPKPGVVDSQPVWDPHQDRLAYARQPSDESLSGTRVVYSRRDDPDAAWRKEDPISWSSGQYDHSPAWAADGSLLFASNIGCRPSPGCESSLRRVTFAPEPGGNGYLEVVIAGPTEIAADLTGVVAVAAHPADPARVAVVDDAGIELLDEGERSTAAGSIGAVAASYTPDGQWLAAAARTTDQGRITVWPSGDTAPAGSKSLTSLLRDALETSLPPESNNLIEAALRGGIPPVRSLSPGADDSRLIALLGDDSRPPLLLEIWIDRGRPMVIAASTLPEAVTALGVPSALTFSS